LAEFGFEEYLFGDGICLLEWANIVASTLPQNRYDVTLELGEAQSQRIVHIDKAVKE
jgi:tRNA threonylcarbamoyladenosine biosynthesis protein TsaE